MSASNNANGHTGPERRANYQRRRFEDLEPPELQRRARAAAWAMSAHLTDAQNLILIDAECTICNTPVHREFFIKEKHMFLSPWMHEYAAGHPVALLVEF